MLYWTVTYSFLSLTVYPLPLVILGVVICLDVVFVGLVMGTAAEALRLDAISRSPTNSLFSSTI